MIRSPVLAFGGVFAACLLAAGSAPAAVITSFTGSYTNNVNGTNQGISASPNDYQSASVLSPTKTFYLNSGTVASTTDPSTVWTNLPLSNLAVDVTNFTPVNAFVAVTNPDSSSDSTLLEIGPASITSSGGIGPNIIRTQPHADFTMAADAAITTGVDNTTGLDYAQITIGVTLRDTSVSGSDDLSAFNANGGGTFTLTIENILINPNGDGNASFPIDSTKPVTVNYSIVANPATQAVPEPASIASLLSGAGFLGLLLRRRHVRA